MVSDEMAPLTTRGPAVLTGGALPRLRPYQVEIGRAVLASVLGRRGLTFTVEIARQGGKNELSAQLETLLLTLGLLEGGSAVKAAPTFAPQALISLERLKARLTDAGFAGQWRQEHGNTIRLGRARQSFLSAEPSANVVGATANVLLEVDEAQDVDSDTYQKNFRPMGASANATTVLYGTPWDAGTLLEAQKQANLAAERRDGGQRHFRFDWRAVAQHNPAYGRYVLAERDRLGETHPLFRTQYALELVQSGAGFFSRQQLSWLQGDHSRRHRRADGAVYIAGVDVAGEAAGFGEAAPGGDARARQREPGRDSTVATIARLDFGAVTPLQPLPRVEVVEHVWWTGRSHATLVGELAGLLGETWGCRKVAVDATGLGAGVASMLTRQLGGSVTHPFVFTAASKSTLGFQLLAAVNAHRLALYAADGSEEHQECLQQLERAQARYRPNQQMNFFVQERDGHDDFLMSLALAVAAANLYQPRSAKGRVSVA